jgi:hypothetical protein
VTVTFSAPLSPVDVFAVEYAGLDPAAPLDVGATRGDGTATATSGPVTTQSAPKLVFGAGITLGAFTGAGGAATLRELTSSGQALVEDRVVPSIAAYSADAPLASSAAYVMQVATFR